VSWVKMDDKFPRHRRIRELRRDTAAKWLHVTALCFCSEHLTDGRIDDIDLPSILDASELTDRIGKRSINNLVAVGLWESTGAGSYVIRDFLDYNPSAAEVKDLRASRAEAGRRGGVRSGTSRRSNNEANASRNGEALASSRLEPRPVPSRKSTTALELDARAAIARQLGDVA
jgi:hypothetical protein